MLCTCRSPTTMSARPAMIGSTSRGMSCERYWLSASVLTITSAPSLSAASSPAWKAVASPLLVVSRTRWSTPLWRATSTVPSVEPSSTTSHSTRSNPGTSRGSSASRRGRDSSSFRQGTWMTSFIPGDRRVCSTMLAVERIGDGPPILFIHGDIVGPKLTWRKQRELADRWRLIIPSRPGFGASPALERNDFEVEAPMLAELLGEGAHLVGHSYGAVIALLVAAERPEGVRSLTVSEPGCLRVAQGTPAVDEMIANGQRLFEHAHSIPSADFLRLFRGGAGSAFGTPDELPADLLQGVELLKHERPPWEAEIPLDRLAEGGFPVQV